MFEHRHGGGNRIGRFYTSRVFGDRGLMWITCPHDWLRDGPHGYEPRLWAWKEAGYPNGILADINLYDWILSPDPGCEL